MKQIRRATPLIDSIKSQTLSWLLTGTVFALFFSAMVAWVNLRTSAEYSAEVEAQSMARSFRSEILGGDIKNSENQMRQALRMNPQESIKVLDANLNDIFSESARKVEWPQELRTENLIWKGPFDFIAAVPIYFDQEQSSLFGYIAIKRHPQLNWSLLITIFGSLMAGQFLFAWIYRVSLMRVGSSLSRQLGSITGDGAVGDDELSDDHIVEFHDVRRAFRKAAEEINALSANGNRALNLRRVAHDIRSPLTAFSLVIKSLGEIPEPTRDLLEMAYRRMEVITTDILAERNHETIAVGSLRENFEDLLTEKCTEHAARDVSWSFKFEAEDALTLNVSISTLMATISNLLNNAAEASPRGGMIRLEVRSNPSHLVIAISDEGPGIPLSQQPLILAGGLTSKQNGNGIGLSTAKRFAEAHSGHLTMSNRELGFEVELTLALAKEGSANVTA